MAYQCKIIADSVCNGHRITSFLLTYPRIIHAELMTHRMFSRNSASSRAIPFEKMVKMVEEDPFIPIAWQKDHKGMQGTEYLDPNQSFRVEDFLESLKTLSDKIDMTLYHRIIGKYSDLSMTLPAWWLFTRDKVLEASILLNVFGITKQICNRLLEPFMWHTVLVTATEYDNFFDLRCPKYYFEPSGKYFNSRRDFLEEWNNTFKVGIDVSKAMDLESLTIGSEFNKSQAEIHIQTLAELMWDAYNESTPNQLEAGEWHMPFMGNFDPKKLLELSGQEPEDFELVCRKIAVARCARLSYMTFDGVIDYEKDIKLYDRLLADRHASSFEHVSRCLTEEEYNTLGKMILDPVKGYIFEKGWVDNFKGFVSYRRILNF